MREAAQYLNLSYWTVRDYVLAERIPIVALPPLRPREGDKGKPSLRRVLIDRRDIDAFIDACKEPASGFANPVGRQVTQ